MGRLAPTTRGAPGDPGWGLKGAETNWFCRFVPTLAARYTAVLPEAGRWIRGCAYIVRDLDLLKLHPIKIPLPAIQDSPNTKQKEGREQVSPP